MLHDELRQRSSSEEKQYRKASPDNSEVGYGITALEDKMKMPEEMEEMEELKN